MKAKNVVITGGILNTIMSLFHIFLVYQIYALYTGKPFYPLLQLFAVGGCIMIIFLAYTSLFHSEELVSSKLGKAVLVLNMLVYISRIAGEIIFVNSPSPVIITICLIVAAVYFLASLPGKKPAAISIE